MKISFFLEIRRRINMIRTLKWTDPAFWAAIGAILSQVASMLGGISS